MQNAKISLLIAIPFAAISLVGCHTVAGTTEGASEDLHSVSNAFDGNQTSGHKHTYNQPSTHHHHTNTYKKQKTTTTTQKSTNSQPTSGQAASSQSSSAPAPATQTSTSY